MTIEDELAEAERLVAEGPPATEESIVRADGVDEERR